MLARYGERVHKVALDAGFTCPNRDGSKGIGGCTFCNNKSFHPQGAGRGCNDAEASTTTLAQGARDQVPLATQFDRARGRIARGTGMRPDCVPPPVLELLAEYQQRGHEVWLELGLQSAFDATLVRVNRGHGFASVLYQLPAPLARVAQRWMHSAALDGQHAVISRSSG